MKVSFAEIDEAYLRNKVESGYYSSIAEAVRDAVRKQRESEQNRLLYALEIGEQAVQEGRTQPFAKELMEDITQSGINKAKKGEALINPDVIPK